MEVSAIMIDLFGGLFNDAPESLYAFLALWVLVIPALKLSGRDSSSPCGLAELQAVPNTRMSIKHKISFIKYFLVFCFAYSPFFSDTGPSH